MTCHSGGHGDHMDLPSYEEIEAEAWLEIHASVPGEIPERDRAAMQLGLTTGIMVALRHLFDEDARLP